LKVRLFLAFTYDGLVLAVHDLLELVFHLGLSANQLLADLRNFGLVVLDLLVGDVEVRAEAIGLRASGAEFGCTGVVLVLELCEGLLCVL
jgi:hypothetical protein